jgi:hypothetical protein
MRLLLFLMMAGLGMAPFLRGADAPSSEQQYLSAYLKINEAENAEKDNDFAKALKAMEESYTALAKIHATDPDWEIALVVHRMEDLRAKIAELEPKAGPNGTAANDGFVCGDLALPPKVDFPWKKNIKAGFFWIGEGSAQSSAWDANWEKANHGADTPDDRNGFAPGTHASRENPFYVALPFNDLSFPDLARKRVPLRWQRAKPGKSACQNRWVWIKSAAGRSCYAQWEDVGPGRADDADYVFGNAAPASAIGINLSPAVAQYLGVGVDKAEPVSWRFVSEPDVPPGVWLKYDEQAVIYSAMKEEGK